MSDEVKPAEGNESAESKPTAGDPKHVDGKMFVKVYAPYKVYFEGDAESISAVNQTGPFDILPGHHSFITLLTACDIVVRSPSGDEKIQIQNGIMHVKANSVVVFLDV